MGQVAILRFLKKVWFVSVIYRYLQSLFGRDENQE